MLWPLLLLTGFGFIVAGKAKPKTALNKRVAFGPRSGETWDVEDFPDTGFIVVHSRRDPTLATFQRNKDTKRFVFSQGKGAPTIIAMMREDFEGETPP